MDAIKPLPGEWLFVDSPEALSRALKSGSTIRQVFFLHWSWKVPEAIWSVVECINFHMTDLPSGRGGSPLQNLIVQGVGETVLTAFRMTGELDAGPIYLKRPLALHGSAEAVYARAARLSAVMIAEIVERDLQPMGQVGDATVFSRRTPNDSELPSSESLTEVHDFIRMLDAEGYPHAFVDVGELRFAFTRAVLYADRVVADVTIRLRRDQQG